MLFWVIDLPFLNYGDFGSLLLKWSWVSMCGCSSVRSSALVYCSWIIELSKEEICEWTEEYSCVGYLGVKPLCLSTACFTANFAWLLGSEPIFFFYIEIRCLSFTSLLSIPFLLAQTSSQAFSNLDCACRFLVEIDSAFALVIFDSPFSPWSESDELDSTSTSSLLRSLIISRWGFSRSAKVVIKMRFCLLKNLTRSRSLSRRCWAFLS